MTQIICIRINHWYKMCKLNYDVLKELYMAIKEIDYYFDRYYKNPISQEITKNIVHDKFKFNFDDTKKNHQVIQKWWDRGHLFEKDVSSFLTRTLKPGDIAIDVGANIGVHSILMNRLIGEGKGGKVISIEPGKEAFEEEDARQLLKVDVAFISYATTLTTTQRERERKRGNSF